jgi:class 3 adenylate cyclase/tetratricopeptide (TPR) repeat protein
VPGVSDNAAVTTCASCGGTNPEGFRFCGHCGAALVIDACATCGASNPLGQRFCGQCGSALGSASPAVASAGPPQEERKLATVLFADVVGFTSLAERTDHEVVARTVDAAFRRLAEVVAEHGGIVDKYMGDSVMAVFGVPQAHDDDAERAVAAALAMRELGGDLSFSIGVNSGELMVAALGPEGGVTVIGDAVNVAARLEKAAGPGEVLVGPLTAELAGRRVVLRERGPVLVKGKSEPVPVYEAIALRQQASDRPGEATPLVGRDGELAFLLAQWQRVRDDRRAGVVVVTGESGAGKSRLMTELCAAVAETGSPVVRAAYPGYGGLGGMRLAAEMFAQLGTTGDAQIDTRVRSVAGELHPSLIGIDPNALAQEQLWAVRRLFEVKTATQPLLVVLDDLHRAPAKTIETLAELSQRLVDEAVLLVLVGRSDPSEWLGQFPTATTVRLSPLARSDAAMLARAYVSGAVLGDDARAFLVERSGGNPLYLRELVTVLRDRGGFVRDGDDVLHLARELPVPATLQAVLAARLDALAPAQKLVLQHVAVLGEAATADQVAALGSPSGAGWPGGVPDAADVLRGLCDAGLLRLGAGGAYDVVDPLLREVAYESLPRSVRGERHRASAASATTLVDRARHLGRAAAFLPDDAALAADAVAHLKDAARELRDRSRATEAIRFLERAVELAPGDVDALLVLAKAHFEIGQNERANEILDRVPPVDDREQAAQRDHLRAASRMFADPSFAANALLDVATQWRELDRPADEGWALANAGVAFFNQSRMDDALRSLEASIEPFRRAGDRSGEMAAYSFLSLVRPNDPRVPQWLDEALAWHEERGDQQGQLSTLLSLGWFHFFRQRFGTADDVAELLAYTQRGAALADDLANPMIGAHLRCLRSNVLRLLGRVDEAAAVVDECDLATLEGKAESDLVRASRAVVTLARDPEVPVELIDATPDPTSRAGAALQAEALALAGRADEAAAQFGAVDPDGAYGTAGALRATRLLVGMSGVIGGRRDADWAAVIEAVRRDAIAESAGPARLAADALLAELSGDRAALEALPSPPPDGLAGALVLRARAMAGDEAAAAALVRVAENLCAPGLSGGIRVL